MTTGTGAVLSTADSVESTAPARALVTDSAADLLRRLRSEHGPLMLHQSGGCCDGSSPMLYPAGEFIVGDRDVLLGVLLAYEDGADAGIPLWISGSQFAAWRRTQLILDVVPGRGGGFSLEAPEGVRLLTRGRAFDAAEQQALAADPLTGADVEVSGLPGPSFPTVLDAATDPRAAAVCPLPSPRPPGSAQPPVSPQPPAARAIR
jgi:uncharacterized protein (DUF779 family)